MRTLRKRLTVANDGFCNYKKIASERMEVKAKKYISDMNKKGWKIDSIFSGDAFSRYETIIHMYKN
jgi:hypothetical protein